MYRSCSTVSLLQVEDSVSHYEYTITPSGVPLRLHMMGAELALNSHYDEYILDFKSFKALDEANEEPFGIPEECHEAAEVARRPLSLLLGALVPKVRMHCPAVDPSAPHPAGPEDHQSVNYLN